MTFDGKADLLERTPSGGLFRAGQQGHLARRRAYQGSGWQNASWVLQADLDRDFYQDLIMRDKGDGKLFRSYLNHTSSTTGCRSARCGVATSRTPSPAT